MGFEILCEADLSADRRSAQLRVTSDRDGRRLPTPRFDPPDHPGSTSVAAPVAPHRPGGAPGLVAAERYGQKGQAQRPFLAPRSSQSWRSQDPS